MPSPIIIVTGTVQGVFFRSETQEIARKLGVTGWVRNTDEDSVEIHAEGTEDSLKKLEEWCHRGPPSARVTNVAVADAQEKGLKTFEIVD